MPKLVIVPVASGAHRTRRCRPGREHPSGTRIGQTFLQVTHQLGVRQYLDRLAQPVQLTGGHNVRYMVAVLLVGVLLARERAAGDVGGEGGGGVVQDGGQVGVFLDELGGAGGQAGHVLPDQDLGVAG